MSLSPLLKHVYNHGTEEVIRRGKRIYHTSGVQIQDIDHLLEQVRFRVRNDQYYNYYTVTINNFSDPKTLAVRCQCPYNLGEICRHEVAALFQLNDMVQSGYFRNANIKYNQSHTTVRMRQVTDSFLSTFAGGSAMEWAREHAIDGSVIVTATVQDRIEASVADDEHTHKVLLRQNEERYFDTACTCEEDTHPLCRHKAAVFEHVIRTKGANYFAGLQNQDSLKNKLLGLYGYSLSDDLTGKFEFTYQDGRPFLRVLDPSIKKVSDPAAKQAPPPPPVFKKEAPVKVEDAPPPPVSADGTRLGIVLRTGVSWYPFVEWKLIAGKASAENKELLQKTETLELGQYVEAARFAEPERELVPTVRKLMPEEILKYLRKTLPFGDFLDDYKSVLKPDPAPEVAEQVWEYLLPKYASLLERYAEHEFTFIEKTAKGKSPVLAPIRFAPDPVQPALFVTPQGKDGKAATISLKWRFDTTWVEPADVTVLNSGLVLYQDAVHALPTPALAQQMAAFLPAGSKKVSAKDWPSYLAKTLIPMRQLLPVHFDDSFTILHEQSKPGLRLYLQERDNMLVMKPVFVYGDTEIAWGARGDALQAVSGKVRLTPRNTNEEDKFSHLLQHLHTDIKISQRDHFYYLASDAVLADNWFFRFTDALREAKVEVLGNEGLKKLRISTHRPRTQLQVSSGIDWFDAAVDVAFGEQSVTIDEVKKALALRQNYVTLGDGSLGLLPEEWLKKYALLVKMGESKGTKLRLKKIHFSVLDELLANVDEEAVQQELEEKKERLTDIIENDYSNLAPPDTLRAELRPYQHSGYQWLSFLQESGWGGILADDMGLGKTVQTLAHLLRYKKESDDAKFLVVCPTTLMYNWEAEIRKFTPELQHFIHHGPKRAATVKALEDFDVLITTYGTMRSDIKMLRDIPFDYAVLDESQAIKNPQSQVAKASLLLNAKHRLALSGTPVQNNTFDLYAQMNFLNPGMLGSREFFMNEFATPIDKFSEDAVKQQLRRLTYPFMLRRTKEQVAKDLPEKTEQTHFCEMGADQRRIYDAYRSNYKDQLLGLIDRQGIERSQMHILQGLTKLRQICDSPAILNEEEKFGNHSIKQDELMREITENVGNHKALVFSQFLGMLALIRKALEAEGIPYAYFDGSSSSVEREKAVQLFQNDESCRIFLISLKAGGVGLNLTAADYVYIVDPWWNPAVEQQAIDRTHRIGQTKNIFAYRLICKDTIEEKILLLQERKKALASDLVSDDTAFLKKLTREDVAYLLS